MSSSQLQSADSSIASTGREILANAKLLSAMANPARLHILMLLLKQESSVNALAVNVGLSQSALSQHLARLRMAGLVCWRRDAQTVYYSCQSKIVADLIDLLSKT